MSSTTTPSANLALAVDLRYARADVAAAGGGDLGAAAAALRQMRTLAQEMLQAGLTLTGWLSSRDLGEVLTAAYLAVRRSEWAAFSAGDEAFEQQGHFEKY